MKIRTDFVTNSSSSSFVLCGVLSEEFASFIREMLGGASEGYSRDMVGGLSVDRDIVSVVTELQWGNFYIHRQYEIDERTERQRRLDDQRVRKPENLARIIADFLPSMTAEQKVRYMELLENAAGEGGTTGFTYTDQTDGFDWRYLNRSDFVPINFLRNEWGTIVGYDDSIGTGTTVVIRAGLTVAADAFKKCRCTKKIVIEEGVHLQKGALSKCATVETVDLSAGENVVIAGLCADCDKLTTVVLPEIVYVIEANAFAGCENLTNINLPETLLFVHESAFAGCSKLPNEVLKKVKSLSDEAGFRGKVAETEFYIRTHGDTTFRVDGTSYQWMFKKKEDLESWHACYDQYFDYPDTLPREKVVYTIHAKSDASIDMSPYGWKRQKSFSNGVEYLIVDTYRIPNLERFLDKQRAIAAENWDYVNTLGKSVLEKAIELKKSGHPIKIITRKHLDACIAANAFVEKEPVPSKAQQRAMEAKKAQDDKKNQKTADFERVVDALQEHCTQTGKRFDSLLEIKKFANDLGIELENHKRQIAKDHKMTPMEYFVHIGVLSTPKMRFEEMIDALAEKYRIAGSKVTTFGQLEEENPDMEISSINSNARVYSGLTARELLIQRGIMYSDEELKPKNTSVSQPKNSAQIPEDIRTRMMILFAKLDEAYPDKVIVNLHKEHKKWGETITALYRALDYETPKDFLEAYGYTYATADAKGGRPKKNPLEVIEELQRRYPNGAEFKSVSELKDANPDIAPRIKSLENKSKEYFGVPFTQFLRSMGLVK